MYFIIYKDNRGEWRWKYRAANHEDIAVSSEGYKTKQSALNGIALVMKANTARTYDDSQQIWLN